MPDIHWLNGGISLVIALSLAFWERRRLLWQVSLDSSKPSLFHRLVFPILVCFSVWHAWQFVWLGDDAYISFRYAQNFARGQGLVFNLGEWVEGFTNFLWTLLLGCLGRLGFSIPYTALCLDLASMIGVIWVTQKVIQTVISRDQATTSVSLTWSALALSGCAPFVIYGTSGLETMPAIFCVLVGLWTGLSQRLILSGLFFVFAAMMRPDHILFWGCMGLALAIEDLLSHSGSVFTRLKWRRYLSFTLPLIAVFIPYFCFRWWLYGDFFPNTYYAKSGGLSYFSQGFIYLGVFLGNTAGYLWMPLWMRVLAIGGLSTDTLKLRVFSGLSTLIFGAYVAKVGGDFMENRFYLVLLPLSLVTIESVVRLELNQGIKRRWLYAFCTLTLAMLLTRVELIKPYQKRWHIAAEHTWYQVKQLYPLKIHSRYFNYGTRLGKMFEQSEYKPRIAYPCVGLMAFYSDLPIVDTYGLVNRRIAHKTISQRGRPGHEKRGSLEEVLAEGAVLSHDMFGSKKDYPYLAVKMAGTTLYLLQDLGTLKEKLHSIRGIQWPKNPDVEIREALQEGAREPLLHLQSLGERVLSAEHRERVSQALESIDDFETSELTEWEVQGAHPRVGHTRWVGLSGAQALRLPQKMNIILSRPLSLKKGESIHGLIAGGGEKHQKVSLYQGDELVSEYSSTGQKFFSPFALTPEGAGEYRLVISSREGKQELWVDALHRQSVYPLQRSLQKSPLSSKGLYALWVRARAQLPASDDLLISFARQHFEFRWSLDELPEGTLIKGHAFGYGPVSSPIGKQGSLFGPVHGAFMSSYHQGDRSAGRVELPKFKLSGEPIHFLIAGGQDCERVYLSLEVEGVQRAKRCGKRDERFRHEAIQTSEWAGQTGQLVIVDQSTQGWGHIMVDEIVMERAKTNAENN